MSDITNLDSSSEISVRRLAKEYLAATDPILDSAKDARAKKDVAYFIGNFCYIKPVTGGKMRFVLWACQKRLLDILLVELQVIVLKARRLGVSWVVLAYALWIMLYTDNAYIPVFSTGEKAAMRHIGRIKFMYQNLPQWMRDLHPLKSDSKLSIEFANGSVIEAFADTENAARGEGATLAIVDEQDWQVWAWQNWPAIEPIIEGGGQMVLVSTAKSKSGLFANLWGRAMRGVSKFVPVFFSYAEREDRDEAWWHAKKNEYPDEAQFYREYPRTEADAWRSPQGQYFDSWDGMKHILREPYKLVDTWPVYRAFDFGYNHPAVLWIQESPDDQLFIFAELLPEKVTTSELAQMVEAKTKKLGARIRGNFCDPAGKAKTAATGESEIAIMARHGIHMKSMSSGIKDGSDLIRMKLKENRLFVSPDCPRMIQAFEDLIRDVDKAGNLKSEAYVKDSVNDHPMDAFRYYMVNRFLHAAGPAPEASTVPVIAGGLRRVDY